MLRKVELVLCLLILFFFMDTKLYRSVLFIIILPLYSMNNQSKSPFASLLAKPTSFYILFFNEMICVLLGKVEKVKELQC